MGHKGNPLTEARVIAYDDDGVPTRVTDVLGLPTQATIIELPLEDMAKIVSLLRNVCDELSDIKEQLSVITGLES